MHFQPESDSPVNLPTDERTIPASHAETVVLLHGLGRGAWSMTGLARRLARTGYRVHNLGYPRRADSIETAVSVVQRQFIESGLRPGSRLNFVTHSFGGLVLRAYLKDNTPPNLGRIVMLAPPNGGSQIVDRFGKYPFFGWLLGPLTPRLGTSPGDLPARLPVPPCEFGVIAGSRWINPLGPLFLPAPHDGTIPVRQTRLAGMGDHLVVPRNHTFIMDSAEVVRQVIHFLQNGYFFHAD